jgi:hypothetical protein
VMDASASFDPDFVGPGIDDSLQFFWECKMVQGDLKVACRNALGVLLNLTSAHVLRFPPNDLMAGTSYEFSVFLFKSGRSAVASAVVHVATGSFVDDARLMLASQDRVNSNQKVSVICISTTPISSYRWSVREVGAISPLDVSNIDPTGQSLLLSPGVPCLLEKTMKSQPLSLPSTGSRPHFH